MDRFLGMHILLCFLVLFYMIPISFVASLTTLEELSKTHGLTWIASLVRLIGAHNDVKARTMIVSVPMYSPVTAPMYLPVTRENMSLIWTQAGSPCNSPLD